MEEVKTSSIVIQLSERAVFGEEFHVSDKDLKFCRLEVQLR